MQEQHENKHCLVAMDDIQAVEKLPLVLVDALDLNVDKRILAVSMLEAVSMHMCSIVLVTRELCPDRCPSPSSPAEASSRTPCICCNMRSLKTSLSP